MHSIGRPSQLRVVRTDLAEPVQYSEEHGHQSGGGEQSPDTATGFLPADQEPEDQRRHAGDELRDE